MKNVFLKLFVINAILLISNFSKAQTNSDRFTGTWSLVIPELEMANEEKPNFSVLKVFEKDGSYSQIRIQNAEVIIHQKAKIKISSASAYEETMLTEKEGNHVLPGQTHQIKYSFAKEGDNEYLLLEGEFKDGQGRSNFWREAWRKVKPFIPADQS